MRALSAEKLAMLLEVARSMAYAHTATSGEGRRFRVSGLPELPRPINTPEDVERFLEELSPEERARLAEALGRGERFEAGWRLDGGGVWSAETFGARRREG